MIAILVQGYAKRIVRNVDLTVSLANRNARVQVAICIIQATKYANWYGMTVDTRSRRIRDVMIRLREDVGANAGERFLLCNREPVGIIIHCRVALTADHHSSARRAWWSTTNRTRKVCG